MKLLNINNRILIQIAGFTLEAVAANERERFQLDPPHRIFQVDHGTPDLSLRYHYGPLPTFPRENLIFYSGGFWRMYRQRDQFYIPLASPDYEEQLLRLAIMDQSFSRGEVYVRPYHEVFPEIFSPDLKDQVKFDPFQYPLDELLMVNFLGSGRLGIILHAFGLVDGGHGLLLSGVSGAGKTTLAYLWQNTEATLLSDDRIILRLVDGQVWGYGTPWHGDARIASPEGAPLEKLYFINHSPENYITPLSPLEAATRMLVRCFPPFYDPEGMNNTLEIIDQIVAAIPCYELGFLPDQGIVDFIRGHYGTT